MPYASILKIIIKDAVIKWRRLFEKQIIIDAVYKNTEESFFMSNHFLYHFMMHRLQDRLYHIL